jgi:anti-sigma factor RsiW
MTSPAPCPDPSRWSALLAGELPDAEAAVLKSHLAGCEACRASLDRLQVKNPSTEASLCRRRTRIPRVPHPGRTRRAAES